MYKYSLQRRNKILVNHDPLKRCYNGCYFDVTYEWADWETLDDNVNEEDKDKALNFWIELNAYAISQRGEKAKAEFRMIQNETI